MTRKTSIDSLFDGDVDRDADGHVKKKQKLPALDPSSAAQRVVRGITGVKIHASDRKQCVSFLMIWK